MLRTDAMGRMKKFHTLQVTPRLPTAIYSMWIFLDFGLKNSCVIPLYVRDVFAAPLLIFEKALVGHILSPLNTSRA